MKKTKEKPKNNELPVYRKVLFALGMVVLLHVSFFAIGSTVSAISSFTYKTFATPPSLEDSLKGENQYICGQRSAGPSGSEDRRRACSLSELIRETVIVALSLSWQLFLILFLSVLLGSIERLMPMLFGETSLAAFMWLITLIGLMVGYITLLGWSWYKHATDTKREKWRAFLLQLGVIVLLTTPLWVKVIDFSIFGIS